MITGTDGSTYSLRHGYDYNIKRSVKQRLRLLIIGKIVKPSQKKLKIKSLIRYGILESVKKEKKSPLYPITESVKNHFCKKKQTAMKIFKTTLFWSITEKP